MPLSMQCLPADATERMEVCEAFVTTPATICEPETVGRYTRLQPESRQTLVSTQLVNRKNFPCSDRIIFMQRADREDVDPIPFHSS